MTFERASEIYLKQFDHLQAAGARIRWNRMRSAKSYLDAKGVRLISTADYEQTFIEAIEAEFNGEPMPS